MVDKKIWTAIKELLERFDFTPMPQGKEKMGIYTSRYKILEYYDGKNWRIYYK